MRRREGVGPVRYLTFSCWQRLPLLDETWVRDEFVRRLGAARERNGFRLAAYVVMPEHVHLMIVVGEAPVRTMMWGLKKPFSEWVRGGWREAGARGVEAMREMGGEPRFGQPGGGFDRNVRDAEEFWREVGYIHRNPVKRGLVERAEEWAWSS